MSRKTRRQREYVTERRRRLLALAPSAWWAREIEAGRVKTFPIRTEHAAMVRCTSEQAHCGGRFFPAYYVRAGICEECRNHLLLAAAERLQRYEEHDGQKQGGPGAGGAHQKRARARSKTGKRCEAAPLCRGPIDALDPAASDRGLHDFRAYPGTSGADVRRDATGDQRSAPPRRF
jgi:hypothetical protein